VQVGSWYVAQTGGRDRCVRVVSGGPAGTSTVFVQSYSKAVSRQGKVTFKKESGDRQSEVNSADLRMGPFTMMQGRAPAHIAAHFEDRRDQEEVAVEEAEPAAFVAQVPAPASLFAQGHDEGRGSSAMPQVQQAPREPQALQVRNRLVKQGPRFRHTKGLKKLEELGFDDCERVRTVLTETEGNVAMSLRILMPE